MYACLFIAEIILTDRTPIHVVKEWDLRKEHSEATLLGVEVKEDFLVFASPGESKIQLPFSLTEDEVNKGVAMQLSLTHYASAETELALYVDESTAGVVEVTDKTPHQHTTFVYKSFYKAGAGMLGIGLNQSKGWYRLQHVKLEMIFPLSEQSRPIIINDVVITPPNLD